MTMLSALGGFAEMVLGLAFSLGCALLLGFACLRLLLSLMTRQQLRVAHDHNGISAPTDVGSLLWLGAAVAGASGSADTPTGDGSDSGATGSPYLLPAAAPRNRFRSNCKP